MVLLLSCRAAAASARARLAASLRAALPLSKALPSAAPNTLTRSDSNLDQIGICKLV